MMQKTFLLNDHAHFPCDAVSYYTVRDTWVIPRTSCHTRDEALCDSSLNIKVKITESFVKPYIVEYILLYCL